MTGGAAGTFATFGSLGPQVQAGVARRLGLTPMTLPHRSIVDHFAELVCVLAMINATAATIAEEIARLMATEFGEVSEPPIPAGDVGSSTMPQKRNSKMCSGTVTLAAQARALAPLALDAMIQSHEVDGSRSAMMDHAVTEASIITGDVLTFLTKVIAGLELFPDRMLSNLQLTQGLISAEAVMMGLAGTLGRQQAHQVVHHAATTAATSPDRQFLDVLAADPEINAHPDQAALRELVDPTVHVGLSADIARQTSARVREAVTRFTRSVG
jgi:adenylosuccinate lyase